MSRRVRMGIAVLVGLAATAGCSRHASTPIDVVLITLDTTRRDHLGAYGYGAPVSPRLDAFAATADLYEHAYASSSWTIPTHASILTGLHPTDHGAHLAALYDPEAPVAALGSEPVTLAEHLAAHGYATGAFVGAPLLDRRFGLARGFDHYDDAFDAATVATGRGADELTARALAWIRAQGDRPIFLLVNYFDPHVPYTRREPCYTRLAHASEKPKRADHEGPRRPYAEPLRLYDSEICFMDEHFGRLIDALRARGRLDGAVVAVVADHGEAFGEHGQTSHGSSLIEPLIRVPLIVKRSGQDLGRRMAEPIEARSLFHLLLRAAGVPEPTGTPGRTDATPGVVSELMTGLGNGRRAPLRALIEWPWKLVVRPDGGGRLIDLATDPGEDHDQWSARPELRARLEGDLGRWVADRSRVAEATPARLDPETRRRLQALGYLF
jgi:arylsulfatase A-like enzyme